MASNSNKQRRATAQRDKSKATPSEVRKGRPPYQPTPEARELVSLMSANGISQDEIALALDPPCDPKTLRKVFAAEIAHARPRYKSKIAESIGMWLMGRPAEWSKPVIEKGKVLVEPKLLREEVKPNIAMAIFQAKVVLGQTEVNRSHHTVLNIADLVRALSGLTDNELAEFERLAAKAVAAEGGNPSGIVPEGSEDDARTTRH